MFRNAEGGRSRLPIGLALAATMIGIAVWANWDPTSEDPAKDTIPSNPTAAKNEKKQAAPSAAKESAVDEVVRGDDTTIGSGKTRLRANVVLVAEDQPELIPVAANLVSALNRDPVNTFLLVNRVPMTASERLLLTQLDPARTIVVGGAGEGQADLEVDGQAAGDDAADGDRNAAASMEWVSGDTFFQISAAAAKKGWRHRDHVIIASRDEPDAILLGATLASHRKVPFLIVDSTMTGTKLTTGLKRLKTTKVTACVSNNDRKPKWVRTLKLETTLLDRSAAQAAIVEAVGREQINNIVLTRVPNMDALDGISAWASPYFTQPYRSALLLVDHGDGFETEKQLFEFIRQQHLRPRSVTILGGLTTIGGITTTINVPDSSLEGDYTMDVEPGTRPAEGLAASLAVGRFPFMTNAENVLMFSRGLARHRLIGHRLPRMLMVANPNPEHGALPLAETVSRATANEFKNHGVKVSEFYGTPTLDPRIRAAAKDANLIFYEGHLGDQKLFEDSSFLLEGEPDSFEPEMDPNRGNFDLDHRLQIQHDVNAKQVRGPPWETPDDQRQKARRDTVDQLNALDRNQFSSQDGSAEPFEIIAHEGAFPNPNDPNDPIDPNEPPFDPDDPEGMAHRQLPPLELDGMPVLILQSCYSLTDWVTRRVSESGGVAAVGSVTKIHSASGSTFMKVFGDNLLYHNMTLGEAVRDARNYFLCLQDLKNARGHKEQYKSMRVAMSFRLWGDPELVVFPRRPSEAKRTAVSIQFAGTEGILVQTPGRRLTTSRTGKYILAQHPGAQAAGLVKRKDADEPARILPIYYARLPLPEGFNSESISKLARAKDRTTRAAWRVDEFGRHLHVIYFPQKDRSHAVYELQFHR